jgi:pyruvate ferredoxin oxidoreductase alpha subunit
MTPGIQFLSGNDAAAIGVGLAQPQVIALYPITPQTTLVERLAEWKADGLLAGQLLNMESEHSALSAVMGASALGVRTFTATSSQGLLYMSECLHYAAGGRFPIVMVNANRAVALPWSIFGDQRDSLSQLECGWIQLYAENAQEALDLTLQAFALAEDPAVQLPVMLNLDGFSLTHTYEPVQVPHQQEANRFLPPFRPSFRMSLDAPMSLGFSASPRDNVAFKMHQHQAMLRAASILEALDARFDTIFGRRYGGTVQNYRTDDADTVLVTLGSISGLARDVVDELRAEGKRVGLLRLRCLRPFPADALRRTLARVGRVAVLEKNMSSGFEGTVTTHVRAALQPLLTGQPTVDGYVAGLGGQDISRDTIRGLFTTTAGERGALEPSTRWLQTGFSHE